jgi:hypothetical protein
LIITRRAFNTGLAAVAAIPLLPKPLLANVPPRDEGLVLARATEIDLSAQETAVVLAPVPSRRPPQRPKLAKGEKPPAPRTWIVLRDVVATDRAPVYDFSLVLEGTNVFAPTTTTQPVGVLEFGKAGNDTASDRKETFAFDVTEALAKLSKTRGFNMRYLRLTIVRRAAKDDAAAVKKDDAGAKKDDAGKETAPAVATPSAPPEIGTIELVRW